IDSISLDQAANRFRGRSLVLIDTGDPALDEMLSAQARQIGVPVNVPDKPALCSFYLGSIVDRDPVILAISTGGFAPVLAQRLRAAIEDWLPVGYGRLATYLHRIRHRLRHLPAARRRSVQHEIIDGKAADHIIDGDDRHADSFVLALMKDLHICSGGAFLLISAGENERPRAPRRDIETIRNADVILHAPGEVPELVHLARREVELVSVSSSSARARAAAMRASGLEVVILQSNRSAPITARALEGVPA
ncbi:MAG: NAD(P)-dependent oxidoreductase, partial [Alphaproteobacteria bacterium]